MATIQEIISKAVTNGDISADDALRISERYGRLLERSGDPKTARLQLAEWLEQEVVRRRATRYAAEAVSNQDAAEASVRPSAATSVKVFRAAIGAVLAPTIVLLLYIFVSLLFSHTTSVRISIKGVLGILALPFLAAVGGAYIGWHFGPRDGIKRLNTLSMPDRASVAWSAMWTVSVVIAFALFDPFHRIYFSWWRSSDWLWLMLIWIGPIVGGWFVVRVMSWVGKGHTRHRS